MARCIAISYFSGDPLNPVKRISTRLADDRLMPNEDFVDFRALVNGFDGTVDVRIKKSNVISQCVFEVSDDLSDLDRDIALSAAISGLL